MEVVSNVSSINKFPEDAQILRNIASDIDSGALTSKRLVVVMLTDDSIKVFGGNGVNEDSAISMMERGKHTICKMMDSYNA